MEQTRCRTCRADWSRGEWSGDCAECGGGALTRPCPECGGQCGGEMEKKVRETRESGLAHWEGHCLLGGDLLA